MPVEKNIRFLFFLFTLGLFSLASCGEMGQPQKAGSNLLTEEGSGQLPEEGSGQLEEDGVLVSAGQPFKEKLAYRWAPIHSQDVDISGTHSFKGKADYITKIDFDGNWNTLNNWKNMEKFPLRSYVYYSVVATRTHWFIVYAFYHPRDWADGNPFGIDEHENDMEGFLTIVKRPTIFSNDDFGNILGIVTVCHNDFYSYVPAGSPLTAGTEDIDGTLKLKLFDQDGLLHPRTSQTAKSHCLRTPEHVKIKGGDGIKYFPTGIAEIPLNLNREDRNVGYKLINIFDDGGLWSQRENPETFFIDGVFRGDDGASKNAAHAPWKWNDHDDGPDIPGLDLLPGGELATDPVKLVKIYFNGLGGSGSFSSTYTDNSYIVEEPPAPTPPHLECKETMFSVKPIPILTSAENVGIVSGDAEIDSNDWTGVELEYDIRKVDSDTKIELNLAWYAQELNKNRTRGDTRFRSSKTFTLFDAELKCPGSRIASIEGLALEGENSVVYPGELRGFLSFPDTGSLREIKVQVDAKGRHDDTFQSLQATLSGFTVHIIP